MVSTIDLTDVIQAADQDAFWALRAKAIQAYASLEQSLFLLFAKLTGMSHEAAGIVFFKITSAAARNSIIEKLFQKSHGVRFNLFRNSLVSQLRPIDIERNEIVHWNTVTLVGGGGFVSLALMPPTWWTPNAPSRDTVFLLEFICKCDFYRRLLNMFCLISREGAAGVPGADKELWLDVFSKPIIYPPPADHPFKDAGLPVAASSSSTFLLTPDDGQAQG